MDATALARQHRRIERLKFQGITRSTVFVHEKCKALLDNLRSQFLDPRKAVSLEALVKHLQSREHPTNVSQVRQLSPFRYPGGKTWLVPEVRKWLLLNKSTKSVFIEPFAGGSMAGLTAAAEALVDHVYLCELDSDVAAVWSVIFNGTTADIKWFCNKILNFDVTLKNVREILNSDPKLERDLAFRTIVKNRVQRGGIMAAGAGLVKAGEAGRGLKSRWYPETLVQRIRVLHSLKEYISFVKGDAFDYIKSFANKPNAFFFIDPPYTAGGKKAGKRLYTHSEVDHEGLFNLLASVKGSVMATYDDSVDARKLAAKYKFRVEEIPMKNTHHEVIRELLILKP